VEPVTRKLINMLIQLAEAEKHFARAERELIIKIATERNFPYETITDIIRNPEPIESIENLTHDQRYEYLFLCVELIFADRNIFDSEIVFAKKLASKLGFKNQVIDYFISHYGKKTPDELKVEILTRYR
jgi:uncharacterized tellurite resistance protein B-like protein